jgi:hypothetical protein
LKAATGGRKIARRILTIFMAMLLEVDDCRPL